jgi:hypothetical protein
MTYVAHSSGRWGVDAGFGVARSTHEIQRRVAFVAFAPTGRPLFGGVESVATSRQSGVTVDAWGQSRFGGVVGKWGVVGTAGLRSARLRMNAWQEEGADGLSLSAERQLRRSTQADTQVQFVRRVRGTTPWFSGSYRRELTSPGMSTLRVGESSEGTFVISGQPLPRATASGMAGVTFSAARAQMSLSYQVRHADRHMQHLLQLTLGVE